VLAQLAGGRWPHYRGSFTVPTASELFALARQYHQAGNLSQAEQYYRKVLETDPPQEHPGTLNWLGIVLAQQGQVSEAAASFQQLLRSQPTNADAHCNLANALQSLNRMEEAIAHWREALRIRPDFPEVHSNLANALQSRGKFDEAVAHGLHAVRLRPHSPEAHNHLGMALSGQGKREEAIAHYREALRVRPDFAPAHSNLANALRSLGKLTDAVTHYREAVRLQPNDPALQSNLGDSLFEVGRLEEAASHWGQALRLRPNLAKVWNNLGNLFFLQGNLDEALAHYTQAMSLKQPFPEAHWNRSLLWLLLGNFEQGWPEYEWRWTQPTFVRRHAQVPLWDGSDLGGRTILLHAEQGLGDTIQFIRYALLVKHRSGTVLVECHPALVRLLANVPGIDRLLAKGSPLPPFDVQAPLLSLPGIFKTTEHTVPTAVPYLHADPELVQRWRQKLQPLQGLKVGIAWQGDPTYRNDRHRSIALALFSSLARVEGVNLISLQKGPGTEQLQALAGQFKVLVLGNRLDEDAGPFMDTAAIMKNLDLVVSSDTAVAHLAGALGVPVWVALPRVPDWRWLLEREDNPWYPTMRLFRQTRAQHWEDVFERIAEAIKERR
jgi:tetratricopeptide (TPR) repeat protein